MAALLATLAYIGNPAIVPRENEDHLSSRTRVTSFIAFRASARARDDEKSVVAACHLFGPRP